MGLIRRFVALESVRTRAAATMLRFPYTLASAALGVAVAMSLIETSSPENSDVRIRLLVVAALGLPLFTALSTFAERCTWPKAARLSFPALGIILLALYYVSLPVGFLDTGLYLTRTALLVIGLHYLASFAPYLGRGEVPAFWQYNKSLFVRFAEAGLYSAVLYAGLSIAIAAINHLFSAGINEKVYAHLFVILAGLFQTWVFLAGVPLRGETLGDPKPYPNGLKVFAQYILLTLALVYFAILIVYECKILVTWNWPRGWVSQLVLWYSVVGILTLLLLHPLRDEPGQRWIQVYNRWFFRGLVPLVAMLFVAIYLRISDYGVTVSRYLVAGMAVGLAVVVLYFLFSRARDIRTIPIVICILAFLASFGPWGAFSVSERSQQKRLEQMLKENELISDGVLQEPASPVPLAARQEMSSIVTYLSNWHGPDAFDRWFSDSTLTAWEQTNLASQVAEHMHFRLVYSLRMDSAAGEWFDVNLNPSRDMVLDVSNFDYVIDYRDHMAPEYQILAMLGPDSCWLTFDSAKSALNVRVRMAETLDEEITSISVVELLERLKPEKGDAVIEPDRDAIEARSEHFGYSVIVRDCGGYRTDSTYTVDTFSAWLLVRRH